MLIDIKIRLAWRILTVILKECKKMDMAKVPFSRCLDVGNWIIRKFNVRNLTKHPIGSIPTVCNWRQKKCIPVGCVPPACCQYLPACTAPGKHCSILIGRGVFGPWACCTARLLPVSPSMHCSRGGGLYLPGGGGVPAQGVYLPGGCTCLV